MIRIPLPTATGGMFSQRTRLGERDYILRFRHNSRVDSWTLDVETIGDAGEALPVMTGKKMFVGHDLLRRCVADTRPKGRLFVVHAEKKRDVPTGETLSRCRLIYVEEGETIPGEAA